MNPSERRKLASAMFESIPWMHRVGVQTYEGCTWAGSVHQKVSTEGSVRIGCPSGLDGHDDDPSLSADSEKDGG